jgi:hypothetical protein
MSTTDKNTDESPIKEDLDRLISKGGALFDIPQIIPEAPEPPNRNTDMMTIDEAKKKQMEMKLLQL